MKGIYGVNAQRIVDALIESDPDPKALAQRASSPNLEVLKAELLERGWTQVRLIPGGDDARWMIAAEIIDFNHRNRWASYGARVAPEPDVEPMAMNVHRTFQHAAKKARVVPTNMKIETLRPNHSGVDLSAKVDDPEDVRGDWYVEIEFDYDPVA